MLNGGSVGGQWPKFENYAKGQKKKKKKKRKRRTKEEEEEEEA